MSTTSIAAPDALDAYVATLGGRAFNSMLAGVTFPNADGSDRRELAKLLDPEDELDLVPEPENQWDKDAIAVYAGGGRAQLGYLDGRTAKEVARNLRKGVRYRCFFRATRENRGQTGISIVLVQLSR